MGRAPKVAKKKARKLKNLWKRKDATGTEIGFYQIRARVNGAWLNESTGVATQTEAEAIRDRRLREVREMHGGIISKRGTVAGWWKEFDTFLLPPNMKASTRDNYLQCCEPFVRVYGEQRLADIDSATCQNWLNALAKTHAQGTIHKHRINLKAFFGKAVEQKKLIANPWAGKQTKAKKGEPLYTILKVDDQAAYLGCLDPDDQRFVLTVLETGLRHSEIDQLCPRDVTPTLVHVRGETAKYGKERHIAIQPATYAVIEAQRVARGLSKRSTEPLWFHSRSAAVPLKTRMQVRLKRLQRRTAKVDLGDLHVHDLRRTYGTRCALAGVMPKTLMLLMGHESLEVTMIHYIIVEAMEAAAAIAKVSFPRPE